MMAGVCDGQLRVCSPRRRRKNNLPHFVAQDNTMPRPVKMVAAVLAAAAVAAPVIVKWEGWRNTGYSDPAPGAYPTICAGHMQNGVIGKTFTDDQCSAILARDEITHGLAIGKCLPPDLPTPMRAAFISTAYNIGSDAFCRSSMSRKALAGDFRGACDALSLYIKSGGKTLPGLVSRRADERTLCLSGIHQ